MIKLIEMLMKDEIILKKKILSPHHQMFTLKYVNKILRRICHANNLLDKGLLEQTY